VTSLRETPPRLAPIKDALWIVDFAMAKNMHCRCNRRVAHARIIKEKPERAFVTVLL
jgi:hypothetical protein